MPSHLHLHLHPHSREGNTAARTAAQQAAAQQHAVACRAACTSPRCEELLCTTQYAGFCNGATETAEAAPRRFFLNALGFAPRAEEHGAGRGAGGEPSDYTCEGHPCPTGPLLHGPSQPIHVHVDEPGLPEPPNPQTYYYLDFAKNYPRCPTY